MSSLELIVGYLICAFVGLLGFAILWGIFTERIDLKLLISEKSGEASMSRFQLLVFTFVIALSFFLIVICYLKACQGTTAASHPSLPDVPSGVLALLGISASSYTVSKAIQPSLKKGGDDSDGGGKGAADAKKVG
jgi:hypothetical protein